MHTTKRHSTYVFTKLGNIMTFVILFIFMLSMFNVLTTKVTTTYASVRYRLDIV